MTNKELIEQLQKFPPDAKVLLNYCLREQIDVSYDPEDAVYNSCGELVTHKVIWLSETGPYTP